MEIIDFTSIEVDGFRIDREGVQRLTKELQAEFAVKLIRTLIGRYTLAQILNACRALGVEDFVDWDKLDNNNLEL